MIELPRLSDELKASRKHVESTQYFFKHHTFFKSSWLFKIHVEVQQIRYIIFETNVTGISQFDMKVKGQKYFFKSLY